MPEEQCMSEDELDERLAKEWDSGRSNGRETMRAQIVKRIESLSTEYFVAGNDDMAQTLRELSRTVLKEQL